MTAIDAANIKKFLIMHANLYVFITSPSAHISKPISKCLNLLNKYLICILIRLQF